MDRFVVMGTRHLDYLAGEYSEYYDRLRPLCRLEGNRAPAGPAPPDGLPLPALRDVARQKRLGGVIKHFYCRAA